jgi:hypothetical protein
MGKCLELRTGELYIIFVLNVISQLIHFMEFPITEFFIDM